MKLLVTGGTGALGQELVRAAEHAGYVVRVASRRGRPPDAPGAREWARVDLATGEGVAAALADVDAVVHAATDPRRPDAADVEGTARLVGAARAAGVGHVVYPSIVGVDAIPFGYYRRKAAAERLVAAGGVPYSTLRATQFHSLVDALLTAAARVPFVLPLPTAFRVQSVAAGEVAGRLLRCLADGPGGRLPDFGGPEVLTLGEAAEAWREVREVRKRVVPLPLPGRTAAAFRAGRNTVPRGEHGTITWRAWLRGGAA